MIVDKALKLVDKEQKKRARYLAKQAVRKGWIQKLPCEHLDCLNENSEMHHPDYNEPLTVLWICREHHYALHTCLRLTVAGA